jgi:glycosyltransferase involved in cell wall biosynthesis
MKQLGIDARLIEQTGVGTYIQELLRHLPDYLPEDLRCFVFIPDSYTGNAIDHELYTRVSSQFRWHSLAEQTSFLQQLNRYKLDLIHFPYFSFPIFYRRPYVLTIHDVTPLQFKTGAASTHHPALYYLKHLVYQFVMFEGVQHAKKIITPTKSVKKDLSTIYGVEIGEKTEPIYLGIKRNLKPTDEALKRMKGVIDRPYLLRVGNFFPHKNTESLLIAFSQIRSDMKLLLVGPQDYFTDRVKSFAQTHQLLDHVEFIHDADDHDLAVLYAHAEALIQPSFAEGFGLPILEATSFQKPIIASDLPVFRELLGVDTFYSFNPHDIQSMSSAIETFISDVKKKKVPRVILERFSFNTMAKKICAIYKEELGI